jgi:putative ABC transport system permease protein
VELSQTEAEGTALARSVPTPPPSTELFFGKGGPPIVHARRFADDLTASVRPALLVMSVAVTLILLMSCANVANLLLSRGIVRQRELAIRAAIGGSRGRLLRQLFTENAMLSAIGGGLGIIVAVALIRVIPTVAPDRFPRLNDIRADVVIMTVAAGASVLTAIIFGLVPAVWGSGLDVAAAMRGGHDASPGSARGPRGFRLRQTVLVFEAAFTIVLLISAGLLTRSFVRLLNVDGGYRAEHLLSARIHLPRSAPPEQMSALIDTVLARLRAIPRVTAAGAGNMMPLTSNTAITTFPVKRTPGTPPVIARCTTYIVTPGYAEALGLHVKEGRVFC